MLGKMRPKYRRQNENQRADKSKIPKRKPRAEKHDGDYRHKDKRRPEVLRKKDASDDYPCVKCKLKHVRELVYVAFDPVDML